MKLCRHRHDPSNFSKIFPRGFFFLQVLLEGFPDRNRQYKSGCEHLLAWALGLEFYRHNNYCKIAGSCLGSMLGWCNSFPELERANQKGLLRVSTPTSLLICPWGAHQSMSWCVTGAAFHALHCFLQACLIWQVQWNSEFVELMNYILGMCCGKFTSQERTNSDARSCAESSFCHRRRSVPFLCCVASLRNCGSSSISWHVTFLARFYCKLLGRVVLWVFECVCVIVFCV